MSDGEVRTRAKDRVLTDQVRESPVDRYQLRVRRRLGIIALLIVLVLGVAMGS
jgi:hypothetical protein